MIKQKRSRKQTKKRTTNWGLQPSLKAGTRLERTKKGKKKKN